MMCECRRTGAADQFPDYFDGFSIGSKTDPLTSIDRDRGCGRGFTSAIRR